MRGALLIALIDGQKRTRACNISLLGWHERLGLMNYLIPLRIVYDGLFKIALRCLFCK